MQKSPRGVRTYSFADRTDGAKSVSRNTKLSYKYSSPSKMAYIYKYFVFCVPLTFSKKRDLKSLAFYLPPKISNAIPKQPDRRTFPMCGNNFLCLLCARSFVPVSIVLSFKFDQYARAAFKFEYGGKNSSNVEEIPVHENCGSV